MTTKSFSMIVLLEYCAANQFKLVQFHFGQLGGLTIEITNDVFMTSEFVFVGVRPVLI